MLTEAGGAPTVQPRPPQWVRETERPCHGAAPPGRGGPAWPVCPVLPGASCVLAKRFYARRHCGRGDRGPRLAAGGLARGLATHMSPRALNRLAPTRDVLFVREKEAARFRYTAWLSPWLFGIAYHKALQAQAKTV
jgi:hypothetical protein